MTSVEKLVERLRSEGYEIGNEWQFQRYYPGRHQRAAAAYSWSIHWRPNPNGPRYEISSCDSVKLCLKAKVIGDSTPPWAGPFEYEITAD